MLEKWETPRVTIQEFEPNEYVAVCWGVECNTDWANQYETKTGDYSHGVTHDEAHCGNYANQVIYDYDNNGYADKMIETGTDGLGNLDCILYLDPDYKVVGNISDVKVGDTIYWTTTAAKDGRTWNHMGKVFGKFPGHPNRS